MLTAGVLERARDLLDQGNSRKQVARQLGVKYDTLRKALKDGRLTQSNKTKAPLRFKIIRMPRNWPDMLTTVYEPDSSKFDGRLSLAFLEPGQPLGRNSMIVLTGRPWLINASICSMDGRT